MSNYVELKKKIQDKTTEKIRLSTQLEGLIKQEEAEVEQLKVLGVVDLDKVLVEVTAEVEQLKKKIEAELVELEK